MAKAKRPAPAAQTTATYYIRNFPRDLTRQVGAAAVLRGISVSQMLAIVVREGLRAIDRAGDREGVV